MMLRPATTADLPALLSLIQAVVPLMRAAGNFQWDNTYPNEAVFRDDIRQRQLWLAEEAGSLAGVAAITEDQDAEYGQVFDLAERAIVVHRLAVAPTFQGRGVAAALLQQAEQLALDRGISRLRIDTNTVNEATQRLFPKLGYRLAGEITLAFRPGLRFLAYEKRLRS